MKFTGISRKQSPLNSHGGTHLGEGHDINQRMQMDPENKKRVNELSQQVKDSLQTQAIKFGKPYFSPKYKVNVDPEDGVLENRPIYSDGTKLTYESLKEPVDATPLNHCGPNHKSPLSHCGSSMMHSEGWNKMRTHNSPNTIGNDAAFKKNEELRSPLNTGENHLWNGPLSRVRKTTKGKGRNFRSTKEGAGMTEKGVKAYKKENPGSKLQTAVTGDVKPGSKAAKRRKSFCARSKGWTGERGKAARRRWKC